MISHLLNALVLVFSAPLQENTTLLFTYEDHYVDSHKYILPIPNITIDSGDKQTKWHVMLVGNNAGHVTVGINSSSKELVE